MNKDSLGDRMKTYEAVPKLMLVRKTPVIIRIDGKAFHTLTRGLKGYTPEFANLMYETALYLAENIQNVKLAYAQSDEISLLLTDYDNIMTDAWFGNSVQKVCSISASMATAIFNRLISNNSDPNLFNLVSNKPAMFDSRCFNIPKDEVTNYYIWRQQDSTRNAIKMLGQVHFSHKQLHGVSCNGIQEMLFTEKGINFNDVPTEQKRGICVIKQPCIVNTPSGPIEREKWTIDRDIPVFTKDRTYIEDLI